MIKKIWSKNFCYVYVDGELVAIIPLRPMGKET